MLLIDDLNDIVVHFPSFDRIDCILYLHSCLFQVSKCEEDYEYRDVWAYCVTRDQYKPHAHHHDPHVHAHHPREHPHDPHDHTLGPHTHAHSIDVADTASSSFVTHTVTLDESAVPKDAPKVEILSTIVPVLPKNSVGDPLEQSGSTLIPETPTYRVPTYRVADPPVIEYPMEYFIPDPQPEPEIVVDPLPEIIIPEFKPLNFKFPPFKSQTRRPDSEASSREPVQTVTQKPLVQQPEAATKRPAKASMKRLTYHLRQPASYRDPWHRRIYQPHILHKVDNQHRRWKRSYLPVPDPKPHPQPQGKIERMPLYLPYHCGCKKYRC